MTRVCDPETFLAATPVERRKLVLAQIDLTPEAWNQRYWVYEKGACGTTACIAGWTCLLAGLDPSDIDVMVGQSWELIPVAAARFLDLPEEVWTKLFAGTSDHDLARARLEALC